MFDASLHISTDNPRQQSKTQETERAQIPICMIPLLTQYVLYLLKSVTLTSRHVCFDQ